MSRDYGWKRFWRSREGTYSLADSGFLVDPEGKYGKLTHPNLMPFARLEGIPGLALLLNISTPTRRTSAHKVNSRSDASMRLMTFQACCGVTRMASYCVVVAM